MALKIGSKLLGYVQTNTYFVYDEDTKATIVFDPAANGKELYEQLSELGFDVKAIFLTHGHFDHIMGVNEFKNAAGDINVYASKEEVELCGSAQLNCSEQIGRPYTVKVDVPLEDGEVVDIAGIKIKLIYTPGHTIGSSCYLFEEDKILIAGDTLFLGSCGRTDLPTGSGGTLDRSLKKLMELDDDIAVYPGHGDKTTIGYERKYNPFC